MAARMRIKNEQQKKREPDYIWNKVVRLWYRPDVTDVTRGQANQAVKAFKKLGAIPAEIEARRDRYLAHPTYGRCACTAMAVVKHWAELEGPTVTPGNAYAEKQREAKLMDSAKDRKSATERKQANAFLDTVPNERRLAAREQFLAQLEEDNIPPAAQERYRQMELERVFPVMIADIVDKDWREKVKT